VRGFDRPNIRLEVEAFRDEQEKRAALIARACSTDGPGIVYVATRKLADELARELEERGLRALAYHAGLGRRRRNEAQETFMNDEVDVVVATTAFGMGVDKANVRFVFHHDPSDSVDSYYQEIGRGGRDDEPAEAVLFYRAENLGARRFFASGGVDGDTVQRVAEWMSGDSRPVDPADLREELELGESKLMTALVRLEDAGALEIRPDGQVHSLGIDAAEVEAAMEGAEERRSFDRSRLEMMRSYAEYEHCRRAFVLSYFGEPYDRACGNCDNCEAGRGLPEEGGQPFSVGSSVTHADWGDGVVQRYDGDHMVVLFDSVGYKTLSVELVAQRNLLSSA
jgi:ATP-dependent DNA helicase RecQ